MLQQAGTLGGNSENLVSSKPDINCTPLINSGETSVGKYVVRVRAPADLAIRIPTTYQDLIL